MSAKKVILSISTFLMSSVILAEGLNAYEGQYVNFNAGGTFANKITQQGQSDSGFLGAAGNVFLGTTLNSYFGAELGAGYYSFSSDGGATIASLNLRFTAPVGTRWSVFGKIGAGYGEITTRLISGQNAYATSGFVPVFGLGVGYGLTSQWMLSLQANGAWFSKSTVNGNGAIGGLTLGATRYFSGI